MPTVCPGDGEIPEGRCLSYLPVPLGLTLPTEGTAHGLTPCCVTLGKSFNLSGLDFLIYEKYDDHTNIMALL